MKRKAVKTIRLTGTLLSMQRLNNQTLMVKRTLKPPWFCQPPASQISALYCGTPFWQERHKPDIPLVHRWIQAQSDHYVLVSGGSSSVPTRSIGMWQNLEMHKGADSRAKQTWRRERKSLPTTSRSAAGPFGVIDRTCRVLLTEMAAGVPGWMEIHWSHRHIQAGAREE